MAVVRRARETLVVVNQIYGGINVLANTRSCSSKASPHKTFLASKLKVDLCTPSQKQPKPDWNNLKFGHHFSDHMLTIEWSVKHGWSSPRIAPFHNLTLHPAAKVLHYSTELFEGMKAYRGVDNTIRLFRPDLNMKRMRKTAERSALPDFSGSELLKCIDELLHIDQEWVPYSTNSSLYIRPTFIGTDPVLGVGHSESALLFVIVGPVGAYYPTGLKPIGLYADPQYVRAWPGGVGFTKAGSNYGPGILISKIAQQHGCQQALWLFGRDEKITEVGTMNIFFFWINENNERELVTPPLDDGLILPGVTRQTLLDITRSWNEFKVSERYISMKDTIKAISDNRDVVVDVCMCAFPFPTFGDLTDWDEPGMPNMLLEGDSDSYQYTVFPMLEVFGAGTACVVSPVDRILYKKKESTTEYFIPTMQQKPLLMQRLYDAITDIQYGRVSKPEWTRTVAE